MTPTVLETSSAGMRGDTEVEFIVETSFAGDLLQVEVTDGGEIEVEFIVDTGFAGDLALPLSMARQLNGLVGGPQERRLATGQLFYCDSYEISLDWNSESRTTEVLVLEGEPLLGTVLMRENLLQVEMTDGGEAVIEPL